MRRDQRAVCFASRAIRRPVPLSTTPAPLRKPRARHELAWRRAAGAAGFRLRLGGGRCAPGRVGTAVCTAAPLSEPDRRVSPFSASRSRSPTADRSRITSYVS